MPTLRELQQSFAAALIAGDPRAGEFVIADGIAPDARLNIYSNTCAGNLVGALRISFPAVRKLVGDDFFEGAALVFIAAVPPKSAYLNAYGAEFPEFLAQFPPASSVPYLADVARLEWAVNVALHAEDAPVLDAAKLACLSGDADPSFVWRAVIDDNDTALAAIDLAQGPAFLVVGRGSDGLAVGRLSEDEWRFAQNLFAGVPLARALATVSTDMSTSLAAHLAAGRFTDIRERSPA
jgi:hypothetical protein